MTLKEKDIVNHLCDNWTEYFPDLLGCKKEYTFRDSRVDILSSYPVDLYEYGIREDENDKLRYINAAVFIEVKFNNNHRDLLYELQKHINFRNWYATIGKAYCFIVVISDYYDIDMIDFMEDNDIIMYKYEIQNNDLNTFTLYDYDRNTYNEDEEENNNKDK